MKFDFLSLFVHSSQEKSKDTSKFFLTKKKMHLVFFKCDVASIPLLSLHLLFSPNLLRFIAREEHGFTQLNKNKASEMWMCFLSRDSLHDKQRKKYLESEQSKVREK